MEVQKSKWGCITGTWALMFHLVLPRSGKTLMSITFAIIASQWLDVNPDLVTGKTIFK